MTQQRVVLAVNLHRHLVKESVHTSRIIKETETTYVSERFAPVDKSSREFNDVTFDYSEGNRELTKAVIFKSVLGISEITEKFLKSTFKEMKHRFAIELELPEEVSSRLGLI